MGALAVLGTASDVGKSLLAAGLCRLLADSGLDVAPFKAQNMANQAGVTADGLEMPRAQILQSRAARQEPVVDMGPVLLKPITHTGAELVVLGRALGHVRAAEYFRDTSALAAVARAALSRLAAAHAVLVLEGAGSPVEMNLSERDFANLRAARWAEASIILVADIDRGGVFAQVKGTLDLLPAEDRRRVLGVVVNRFRGDPDLFADGVRLLESLAGVPVLAVVPHLAHGLDEEDRPLPIPIDARGATAGMLRVGAILSPSVANTEDLSPLLAEPDLFLTWVTDARLVAEQDVLILPGSKATVADLLHHVASGVAAAVREAARRGAWVIGLCGGYQMLGEALTDEAGTEGGPGSWPGLRLLPVRTVFESAKRTQRSSFVSAWPVAGRPVAGYEIHHGRSEPTGAAELLAQDAGVEIGCRRGRALGTYLHGLFADDEWRAAFFNAVRADRGHPRQAVQCAESLDLRIDRWARHLRQSLRGDAWARILAAATA
jgi:adenosylcobyric acid synthase